jgi:hypothetical protein
VRTFRCLAQDGGAFARAPRFDKGRTGGVVWCSGIHGRRFKRRRACGGRGLPPRGGGEQAFAVCGDMPSETQGGDGTGRHAQEPQLASSKRGMVGCGVGTGDISDAEAVTGMRCSVLEGRAESDGQGGIL